VHSYIEGDADAASKINEAQAIWAINDNYTKKQDEKLVSIAYQYVYGGTYAD